MASNNYNPTACRIVPHGLRDDGSSLYFRLAFAPRGNASNSIDPTIYNNFWWDWPTRLYSAWNAGTLQLSWQALQANPTAPVKTVVLNSGNAVVTAPVALSSGGGQTDNTLSWLRRPVGTGPSALDMDALWRALTARVNATARLEVFAPLDSTSAPRVKGSGCSANLPTAHDRINAAETLRATLRGLTSERHSAGDRDWLGRTHAFAEEKLKQTFPYLIHRHDSRTDAVLVPNLCERDDSACPMREKLREVLYKALAAKSPWAAIVERDLARLCQSGRPFEDLTCSALLTVFEPLNKSLACPSCGKTPLRSPTGATGIPASVAWARSATYRGAAQTAATTQNQERVRKAADHLRELWAQSGPGARVAADGSETDIGEITMLANDRLLAELFGLVLDITVSRSVVESALGQSVSILLSQNSAVRCGFATSGTPTGRHIKFDSYSPATVCTSGAFLPEEAAPQHPRMIQGGFLRLGDGGQFLAIDFSYSTFHANYRIWDSIVAAQLNRIAQVTGNLQSLSTTPFPRELRSAEGLLRSTIADPPEAPELLDGVVEIYHNDTVERLQDRLDNESAQQNAGEDGFSIRLYAKDLVRGYGLEVHTGGQWLSQTYATEYRAFSIDGVTWTVLLDGEREFEGFRKWAPHRRVDATGDPKSNSPPDDLHAPESILTWSGFGPCALMPGTVRDSGSAQTDAQHRALQRKSGLPHQHRFSPLRYYTDALLRMPAFDLTGIKLDAVAYDAMVELKVPITRHRRNQPPAILVAEPRHDAESLGETLENIVVRTGASRNDERSQRVLVPPRISEAVAYLEGKFDSATGGRRLRDSGSFADVSLNRTLSSPNGGANNGGAVVSYATYQFPAVPKNSALAGSPLFQDPGHSPPPGAYWPEPRCADAFLVIHNRVTGSPDQQILVPFYERTKWPDAHRIHLIVKRGPRYEVTRDTYGGREALEVSLPPAHQVVITLQSVPESASFDGHGPPVVPMRGLYLSHPNASGPALSAAQAFDATSPARTLTLLHAVDTPLRAPHVSLFNFRQIIDAYVAQLTHPGAQKAVTDTTVAFNGSISVDYKSTGKITLLAAWDEATLAGGHAQTKHFEAPLATLDTNQDTLDAETLEIIEALDTDTTAVPDWVTPGARLVTFNAVPPRARGVKILARAGVRDEFSKYFPEGKLPGPVQGDALPALWLNSRRPPVPRLKQAIHTFVRYRGDAREDRRRDRRSKERARTASGLCIYVDEPLQDSGERGLLGVVLWQQPRSHPQRYPLSRQSNDLSDGAPPAFDGMNFSADYPVKGDGPPYAVTGDVPTLDKVYCDRTRNHVTRWAGDVFDSYPKVPTAAPTLANFVLEGSERDECVDPYTGKPKPYGVTVFDYVSVGGLEPFETDPTSNAPPPIGGSATAKKSLPWNPVTILGYEPQYDAGKGLYFYEIRFQNFLPETFLKLGLVYLQPNSLRFAECSEVVFTPYIKPLGDRFTVITPGRHHEFDIDVFGSHFIDSQGHNVEEALIGKHGAFRIELYAKDTSGRSRRSTAGGSNTRVTLEVRRAADRGPSCLWSGHLVIIDSDLRDCRLVVNEVRQYAQTGSTWPEPDVGEVIVYWEQFET